MSLFSAIVSRFATYNWWFEEILSRSLPLPQQMCWCTCNLFHPTPLSFSGCIKALKLLSVLVRLTCPHALHLFSHSRTKMLIWFSSVLCYYSEFMFSGERSGSISQPTRIMTRWTVVTFTWSFKSEMSHLQLFSSFKLWESGRHDSN